MEFIKKMKTREFIEMALKTATALLLTFIAIILMECMIYGIELNSLKESKKNPSGDSETGVAYCIEDGVNKDGEMEYFVILRITTSLPGEKTEYAWSSFSTRYTKDEIKVMVEPQAGEIVYRAPTAFELTIKPFHYAIMTVFVLVVSGFFVYKFIKLAKTYKEVEENFKKNGTIEISNM